MLYPTWTPTPDFVASVSTAFRADDRNCAVILPDDATLAPVIEQLAHEMTDVEHSYTCIRPRARSRTRLSCKRAAPRSFAPPAAGGARG